MSKWKNLSGNVDFLEDDDKIEETRPGTIKVLIADDDKEIHEITKVILRDFDFEGERLDFLDAYSGKETIELLKKHDDVALLLLDVVMESNQTGLELVGRIRKELKNKFLRIVLRTGQPGEAPEQKVIREYDINDYRLKTEITASHLETIAYTGIRNYRDLLLVEHNRQMHEKLLHIGASLFSHQSIDDFFSHILDEISRMKKSSISREEKEAGNSGFVAISQGTYKIIAGSGSFADHVGSELVEGGELSEYYEIVTNKEAHIRGIFLVKDGFLIESKGDSNLKTVIYIKGDIDIYDFDMVALFLTNFSIALDNYLLNNLVRTTQRGIIFALGETVESHYEETGDHVKRTSEMMYRFGMCLNLPYAEADKISLASTLHDLGKIVIPDKILKKAGPLTDEEFEIIKSHTVQGYNILRDSELPMLQEASLISLCHHEKYDGSGYPKGLSGEAIPLSARMMAIVDSFDAMVSKRVYKEGIPVEDAMAELERCKSKHFDPELTQIFLENIKYILGNAPN
ncbi:MAG: DUF3369 domain-containing protein [Spirochaetales bacterium]|nr:DUF3369 domain-containing protein [Spirochaetales bacterium]